jgi:hypothetical protein
VAQSPVALSDALGAQSLELGVLFLAADVYALAELRVGEPVRSTVLDELPRGEAGPDQRLALETRLREDRFGIGGRAALKGRASDKRDGEQQSGVSHDGSFR